MDSSSLRNERNTMIRQVIYCDVCGAQRRETNHWFIAYELSGELRASGWTSQSLHHPGIKHLCGESCLHKLLSEFLASSAQMQTVHTEAFVAQSAAASVDMAFVAEPSVSRSSQTQFTSTSSKASQHVYRRTEARRRKCAGRRTS